MEYFWIIPLLCIIQSIHSQSTSNYDPNIYDVTKYGAVGDQKTDDSQAFIKAWKAACAAKRTAVALVIPEGKTFLVKTAKFTGPCKPLQLHFQVVGNLVAPNSLWSDGSDPWLTFDSVDGLIVEGGGQIDGKGAIWWQHFHKVGKCERPTLMEFYRCKNTLVKGITLINSPRNHLQFSSCTNASVLRVHISAPEFSPNTDGINIGSSTNISVTDTYIAVGDDCVGIGSGSSHVYMTLINCGPGHGISIGSLGLNKHKNATVEEIHVKDSILSSTTNGLRIKTWEGAGGYARHVSYTNVTLRGTHNPIIIDQHYCPHHSCPKTYNTSRAVEISNISFIGITGTVQGKIGVNLNCSTVVGCTKLLLNNINLRSANASAKIPISACTNAHGKAFDIHPPVNCLLP